MKAKLLVLPGQGSGAEILPEAVRVLDVLAAEHHHELTFELATLEASDRTVAACKDAAALLIGPAVGDAQELSTLRRSLGLFASIAPLRVPPSSGDPTRGRRRSAGFDILVVSEHPDAADKNLDAQARNARIVHAGARLARRRWGLLTQVDSTHPSRNALDAELAKEFPDVSVKHEPLDVAARTLPQAFSRYDVIVGPRASTEWLIQGALSAGATDPGASGYYSDGTFGMYQATDTLGAVTAAAMMLRYSLNLGREAAALESAVAHTLAARAKPEGRSKTPPTPRQLGDILCRYLTDGLYASQAV
jgi:3-isopropylmalate dehydrogenase